MSELDHEVVCVMLKMCEPSSLEVGGPKKVDIKIRVESLMGNEFGEVGIIFSKNHLPPRILEN